MFKWNGKELFQVEPRRQEMDVAYFLTYTIFNFKQNVILFPIITCAGMAF